MKSKIIISGIILFSLMIMTLFQNCSEAEFDSGVGTLNSVESTGITSDASPETPEEPPPNVQVGEKCVTGKKLSVFSDHNDDGSIQGEELLGAIVSYEGSEPSYDNYNYYSDSAHPKIGPTPQGFESHVFFYEGPDGLALNFYHNVDKGGSADNRVNWDIYSRGNNSLDELILSDDGREMKLASSKNGVNYYQAYFRYYRNTDGGVIGPFQGSDFQIQVKVAGVGDVKSAAFYSANGDIFSLADKGEISSFIIAFNKYEDCR